MKLRRLFRRSHDEKLVDRAAIQQLRNICPTVVNVRTETCFYIQFRELNVLDLTAATTVESETLAKLKRLLGDSWEDSLGLSEQTCFPGNVLEKEMLVEIGPRLSFSTPWSTNCVSICQSAGADEVVRLEKAIRYLLKFSTVPSEDIKLKVISSLYDPMTQQIYVTPLESFLEHRTPEKWTTVDILNKGIRALREANDAMGLAFDEWDLAYYATLFRERIRRNPTTVELFDLAQSNSEHSRHWFFKGQYILDEEKLPDSLLDMVVNTNSEEFTNDNNVIKFSDNSSGIKGWKIPILLSTDPRKASSYSVVPKLRHIIFTAETHNFPTGVAPFSGATTGTGGRIRDVQAAGRGGHVIAGTAGYCFGNLHIPGYCLEWEDDDAYPPNFATPLEISIEASNGASDYGNKFGEPVICGFARSFGLTIEIGEWTERREWVKPIMFSGGIGSIDNAMVKKQLPKEAQFVVKIGGPAYRIGVGGGAASSVQVQGDNVAARDLDAVQRGDAEMEQKLNRVIRGCLEMETNPILSIHDQGAGGNANVLKEIMEGSGGIIFTKEFSVGDPTLSTMEIWGAEYQESNALLVDQKFFRDLKAVCQRERCPVDRVGILTSDNKVRLIESKFAMAAVMNENSDLPVNLDLHLVLENMPKKVFSWEKRSVSLTSLSVPSSETAMSALRRVLRLPAVASKRYLTNKVDRSVTGLIAQQQCVGPLQTPVADVAVVALSYFSKEGAATSIGEQPLKILVDPQAGARLTVLEALTNLASCYITSLKDVKCSGNWMWAAKLPGEGYTLYQACQAMCELMKQLGIAVDGGKDSLSMAARVPAESNKMDIVKSPGSLVVSAYAPCPNISKIVTPDLKCPNRGVKGALILIKPAFHHHRLGGSSFAQVYKQIGCKCPDVSRKEIQMFIGAFNVIQQLINENRIMALHDISDGGLATTLIEMAIAGWAGIRVQLPEVPADTEIAPEMHSLFSEEAGWVMEVSEDSLDHVLQALADEGLEEIVSVIGQTSENGSDAKIEFTYQSENVISLKVLEAALLWEETSYQLEKLQMNPDLASSEYESLKSRTVTSYKVPFHWKDCNYEQCVRGPYVPQVAVIREEGSNGDRELAAAFLQAGFLVYDVTMSDFITGSVDLNSFRGIAFPGGFSYADVLGSAVGWAASVTEHKLIAKALSNWRDKSDTFSLGICNGCQLMALLGWIGTGDTSIPSVKMMRNDSGRFESRWSRVKVQKSKSILLAAMEEAELGVWVAHGEGKFVFKSKEVEKAVSSNECIALTYTDDEGNTTEAYPHNPNGTVGGIAGLTSMCGRHLALMPHPERCYLSWQWPYTGPVPTWSSDTSPWAKLFQNAFDWSINTCG